MLFLAPHLGANALRNKGRLKLLGKIAYGVLMLLCIALDTPLMIACVLGAVLTVVLLTEGQYLASILFAALSWVLIKLTAMLLASVFRRTSNVDEQEDDDIVEEVEEVRWEEMEDDIEELPFCQLFKIGKDMCLMIDHVELCPDETAFIRVVGDESYTPLYKRKVRRDKADNRFIVFNGKNYYLDNKKTQPIISHK